MVEDEEGALLPYFVPVAGLRSQNEEVVREDEDVELGAAAEARVRGGAHQEEDEQHAAAIGEMFGEEYSLVAIADYVLKYTKGTSSTLIKNVCKKIDKRK